LPVTLHTRAILGTPEFEKRDLYHVFVV